MVQGKAKLQLQVLAVGLLLSSLAGCQCQPSCPLVEGVVGKACIAGVPGFGVQATIAVAPENSTSLLIVALGTEPLACEGPLTRSSPGRAQMRNPPGSRSLELIVDLSKGAISRGRYPITNSDRWSTGGTSAMLAHVPDGDPKPVNSQIAKSGWIAIDEFEEQRVRGTFELTFDAEEGEPARKVSGAFEGRYCNPFVLL